MVWDLPTGSISQLLWHSSLACHTLSFCLTVIHDLIVEVMKLMGLCHSLVWHKCTRKGSYFLWKYPKKSPHTLTTNWYFVVLPFFSITWWSFSRKKSASVCSASSLMFFSQTEEHFMLVHWTPYSLNCYLIRNHTIFIRIKGQVCCLQSNRELSIPVLPHSCTSLTHCSASYEYLSFTLFKTPFFVCH